VFITMNPQKLRAERKLGLPMAGRKRELEQRLEDAAGSNALDVSAVASSMEGTEDKVFQGAEKPDRMREVRKY
jgi:hypothetical protein